jgi:hypothetical protein
MDDFDDILAMDDDEPVPAKIIKRIIRLLIGNGGMMKTVPPSFASIVASQEDSNRKLNQVISDISRSQCLAKETELVISGIVECPDVELQQKVSVILSTVHPNTNQDERKHITSRRMGKTSTDPSASSKPRLVLVNLGTESNEQYLKRKTILREVPDFNNIYIQRKLTKTELHAAFNQREDRRKQQSAKHSHQDPTSQHKTSSEKAPVPVHQDSERLQPRSPDPIFSRKQAAKPGATSDFRHHGTRSSSRTD